MIILFFAIPLLIVAAVAIATLSARQPEPRIFWPYIPNSILIVNPFDSPLERQRWLASWPLVQRTSVHSVHNELTAEFFDELAKQADDAK